MTNYYVEKNNKIVATDTDRQRLETSYYGEQVEILETERPIADFQFSDTPEYIAEQERKESERVALLHLTRGDVFRALLKAKGVTRVALRASIEGDTTLSELQKELALIDFDEALEFYRGNSLIDVVGKSLGVTPKQMTKFFETNDYKELTV